MLLARNVPPGSRRVKDAPEPDVLTFTVATYGMGADSGACPDSSAPADKSAAAPAASQVAGSAHVGHYVRPVKEFTVESSIGRRV